MAGLIVFRGVSICKGLAVLFTFRRIYGIIQVSEKREFAGVGNGKEIIRNEFRGALVVVSNLFSGT